jgi:hypothetical protein
MLLWGVSISLCVACESTGGSHSDPSATTGEQVDETVITLGSHFRASGGWPLPHCRLAIVGARWGSVYVLENKPPSAKFIGRLPNFMESAEVSGAFPNGDLLVWSRRPAVAARLDIRTGRHSIIRFPKHRLGRTIASPLVPLSDKRIVAPAFGDVDVPQRYTRGDTSVPVFAIYNSAGDELVSSVLVPPSSGRYLTWYNGIAAVGGNSARIWSIMFSDLTINRFELDGTALKLKSQTRLPAYLDNLAHAEEVAEQPWIDENGEIVRINHVRDIGPVAFSEQGGLAAIRTFSSYRQFVRANVLPPTLLQRREKIGLETYDSTGALVRRYLNVREIPTWMTYSSDGRIVLGERGGKIRVIYERAGTECSNPDRKNRELSLIDTVAESQNR